MDLVATQTVRRPLLGGAVYVLPNLLTTGNLFFGFFSIVKALEGQFAWAASAILLASLFDMLDGRVARLTRGTSEFGVQYDSLCDVVSFGVAPAFLMYKFGLHELGRLGWIASFVFMACGALRLARFNVQSSIGKASGDFTGLPIPMAAIVIATFVSLTVEWEVNKSTYMWIPGNILETFTSHSFRNGFLALAGFLLAVAMVSNVVYRSHKAIKVKGVKPFKLLVMIVLLIGLLAFQPEMVGFALAFSYAVSGPLEWILGWKKAVDDDDIFQPIGDDDSIMEPTEDEGGTTQIRKGDPPGAQNAVLMLRRRDGGRDARSETEEEPQ